ncbi:hypothetical protein F441_18575 [Phytophthora nicotianae CJ01A1]|uniref:Uncharacterized protein n=2 Tax=Phytophthora nicotianae TaxID=4792 RepID=W2W2C6_PHYNI|nr:hypothetical protein F444_18710 [Phytophthora nicotianae P1976]ETP04710.1 hypothetical protein F441_18575 [Phytophthora nicotianae CJ01A1]
MALHMYRGTGFGGEVAPNLSAISDTVGILGVRAVGAIRGGEDVTSAGGFATSSLRVRFKVEASGTSSRARHDPVSG